jgi:hypothetical protein
MIELPSENTLDNHSVGNQIKLGRAFSDLRRIVNKKNGNASLTSSHQRSSFSFSTITHCTKHHQYTMFFFFVGGVEPTVKQTIQTSVAPCPNCHEGSMDLVEMCKTFKAFFIPIWSFGDSRQVLRCNRCKCIMAPSLGGIVNRQVTANGNNNGGTTVCSCCGGPMQPGWHFCPTCGVDTCTK